MKIDARIGEGRIEVLFPRVWSLRAATIQTLFVLAMLMSIVTTGFNSTYALFAMTMISIFVTYIVLVVRNRKVLTVFTRKRPIQVSVPGVTYDNCEYSEVYRDAVTECANEIRMLGADFKSEPWTSTFYRMNYLIKEQKEKESRRITRTNFAERMEIGFDLSNGTYNEE